MMTLIKQNLISNNKWHIYLHKHISVFMYLVHSSVKEQAHHEIPLSTSSIELYTKQKKDNFFLVSFDPYIKLFVGK